ncbi:MAG: nitrate- and nitrite sensing domain-containing protein, partial [Roseibium sp.]|uniref:nitrate- and nitrite sensing domain-containing protein n=1 Tax=Roseibium sp. TaxID=1936156 RepID=UPI00262258E8
MKRIRLQIAVLAGVPMLAVLGFAALSVIEKVIERSHHAYMVPLTRVAEDAGNLIHEIQKERDKTVELIDSGFDAASIAALDKQRPKTDAVLKVFDDHLAALDLNDKELLKDLQHVAEEVHKLDKYRQSIDANSVTTVDAVKIYSNEIAELIHLVGVTTESSPSKEITSELLPYLTLVEAMESGSLERANGAALLNEFNASGKVEHTLYVKTVANYGAEVAFEKEFEAIATRQQKAL